MIDNNKNTPQNYLFLLATVYNYSIYCYCEFFLESDISSLPQFSYFTKKSRLLFHLKVGCIKKRKLILTFLHFSNRQRDKESIRRRGGEGEIV